MPDLLASENIFFAVALALLAMLVIVQATGLGHLAGDSDFSVDAHDAPSDLGGGMVSILGIGRVPLLVWLTCFLASFALLGLSLQQLITHIFGAPFAALPAGGVGLLAALPATSVMTRLLGKVWPHDETTAVDIGDLLGKRGVIAVGTSRRGSPARANVYDRFGQMHNVMVEPHDDGRELSEGSEILLVRREGELFFALDGQGPIILNN